jgi:aspartate-semialdehyde dehydrogenase
MRFIGDRARSLLDDPATTALDLDRNVRTSLGAEAFPTEHFGAPLAASLIPWIDSKMAGGETREEWKGHVESNKILGLDPMVPVDGLCVRVGAMRCHSQGLTVKLRQDVPLDEIEAALASANEWVRLVPNDKDATLAELSPASVTGTLEVPIGRVRKLRMGPGFVGAYSVGDQLLWGAAEPLRRVLRILREHRG